MSCVTLRRAIPAAALLCLVPRLAPARSLVPDANARPGPQIAGNVIDVSQGGVRIRVEPLSRAQVADWFRSRTRGGQGALPVDTGETDSVAPASGRRKAPAPLTVFSVSFENLSGQDLTFVPDLSTIADEAGVERSPLPADWLRAELRESFSATGDPDRAADDAMSAVHADALVLKHGQRASRLMVFPPEPRAKKVMLTLSHLAVGPNDTSPVFAFVSRD